MRTFKITGLALIALVSACGGAGGDFGDDVPTGAPPTVSSISPTVGQAGSAITIVGFGFSEIPPNNIVIIGGAAVAASAYNLVDPPTATDIESITALVPAGAAIGADSVVVLVNDNTSNQDVTFTVTP